MSSPVGKTPFFADHSVQAPMDHAPDSKQQKTDGSRSQGFEAQAVGAALKKVQKASPCLAPRVWAKHRWYRCAWPGNDARKIAIIALS